MQYNVSTYSTQFVLLDTESETKYWSFMSLQFTIVSGIINAQLQYNYYEYNENIAKKLIIL
jgi:hypothetical protein